jgi:hypothetical protein
MPCSCCLVVARIVQWIVNLLALATSMIMDFGNCYFHNDQYSNTAIRERAVENETRVQQPTNGPILSLRYFIY